jgi:glycosyltransferase involved in cell wall biosynthesis
VAGVSGGAPAPAAPPVPPGPPLSLCIVNPAGAGGGGGVERWFLDTATGLRARGHRVCTAGRPGSPWLERAAAEGLDCLETPMRGDLALGEARRLGCWMRARGVEVVATKLHRGIRFGALAARFAGRPRVVAFMGLVEVHPGWRYGLTYGWCLDRILTLTEGMRREILRVGGFDPGFVEAVPYGVDPAPFAAAAAAREETRRTLGAGPADLLLVSVGRLHAQKRFDLLLEAFGAVAAAEPRARLAIVGTGSLQADLEARAAALPGGAGERVRFAGFRPDVAAVHAAADLEALSSDDEGLPSVVLEAMAAGRAFVATDVGSVRDLVEDGATGRVVPRRDPAALASACLALLRDGAARDRMGAEGRVRVLRDWSPAGSLLRTEAFLRRAAAGR